MSLHTDTIAAIATPLGEGGIAVIRVSGPDALRIVAGCVSIGKNPLHADSHTIHLATVVDVGGAAIDQALISVFRGPNSYTSEDIVEISCHGGMLVTRRVLESVLGHGARHASPGEFTKRAFLNGRLDLAQAEAVAELIHASSDQAHRTSLSHLRGEFSDRINGIRDSLVSAMGLLELELDFAEDGYEFVDKQKVERLIDEAVGEVQILIDSYTVGKVIREGASTVLVGAPNAGKSSLMNRLLKESRAIVTEVPGTTRDVISESIMINGVLFRLSDTAGIRPSEDLAEREGVRRSKEKLSTADVIILVLDVTRTIESQLEELGSDTLEIMIGKKEGVQVVLNKTDLKTGPDKLPPWLAFVGRSKISRVSAKTGDGILELEEALLAHVPGLGSAGTPEGEVVTTARHYESFRRVSESMRLALESIKSGKTGEFVALDLRNALDGLGEVVGKVTNEEILNSVFANFCIGK